MSGKIARELGKGALYIGGTLVGVFGYNKYFGKKSKRAKAKKSKK